MEADEGGEPGDHHRVDADRHGPAPFAGLVLDRHKGSDAREIQENEYHIGHRGRQGDRARQCALKLGVGGKDIRVGGLDSFGDSRLVRSVHHAQSTDNQLLCNDTSQKANVHLPTETERIKSRRDSLAELADVRMFLLILSAFVGAREIAKAPDHD